MQIHCLPEPGIQVDAVNECSRKRLKEYFETFRDLSRPFETFETLSPRACRQYTTDATYALGCIFSHNQIDQVSDTLRNMSTR